MAQTFEYLPDIISAICEPAAICNQDLLIIECNGPLLKTFGFSFADTADVALAELFPDLVEQSDLLESLKNQQDWTQRLEVKDKQGQATTFLVKTHWPQLQGHQDGLIFFCPVQVSTPKDQVVHDELTGLPRYDLFLDRVEQALIAAPRINKSVAILMIGLDQFDRVNSGLGYESGDKALQAVGKRLTETTRRSDTVARLDGDRFGLVMQITTIEDSVIVAEKILRALSDAITVDEHVVHVTASIGISVFPTDSADRDTLLKHAESAMRHIKKQGGNHYQFFSEDMNNMAKNRIEVEQSLRRALENEEFVVYYQPKVNLENNAVVGAEALVRWNDPERGLVPPGEFIPIAEETGLIREIGDYVLKLACSQNSLWLKKELSPVRISVNVTAAQFRSNTFVDEVKQILDETALPPGLLELEITESTLVSDMDKVIEKLKVFREMGIGVSIDDFGTGYSSLSYLSQFPITTLKIDRAFVKDMEVNDKTAEITSAIIGLSRGLSLEVVAEGAESIEHVRLLREKGCDLVQGFYFSKPVPVDEFEQILRVGYLYD